MTNPIQFVKMVLNVRFDNDIVKMRIAVKKLIKQGDRRAVEQLIGLIDGNQITEQQKYFATLALGYFGDKRAIKSLYEFLVEHPKDVNILELLVILGETQNIDELIEILEDKEQDSMSRYRTAFVLGNLGNKKAIEPLMNCLLEDECSFRETVIESLGKLGEKSIVETVINLIEKEEESTYFMFKYKIEIYSKTLGRIGDKAAVEPLIKILKQKEGWKRSFAAEALGDLGDKKAVKPLLEVLKNPGDNQYSTGKFIALALAKLEAKQAIKPLIKILNNEKRDLTTKIGAMDALGDLGDTDAVESIIHILANERIDQYVRGFAAESLGKLGDERAVDNLVEIIMRFWDYKPLFLQRSAEALRNIGGKKVEKAMKRILEDERNNRKQRMYASIALGEN